MLSPQVGAALHLPGASQEESWLDRSLGCSLRSRLLWARAGPSLTLAINGSRTLLLIPPQETSELGGGGVPSGSSAN